MRVRSLPAQHRYFVDVGDGAPACSVSVEPATLHTIFTDHKIRIDNGRELRSA